MVVLRASVVPQQLRGYLSRWMYEIAPNVFVGDVSTRIREALWEIAVESCGTSGALWMAYSKRNYQNLEFRTWGTRWVTVDFDGITLVERPLTPK